MARPRIIIADTDVNYILSLQLKFIEEFFEKIDLEIITDKDYFDNLFGNPQRAEILILSEELYDLSIQKHNIGNVFLMTEKNEEEQTADLNITRIFKYTSIKEIFNEILGKSSDSLNVKNSGKKEPQIVVITSAAGGVGKTTIAMGMSACLGKDYKRVLYINCDYLQSFAHLLSNQSVISNNEVYSNLIRNNDNIYQSIKYLIRNEVFSYLPPFKAPLISLGVSPEIFIKIALSAKKSGDYDFIIIDTDSVFDERKALLLNIADKVVIVTRQNKTSVFATNTLVSSIDGINTEKYIFICNDFVKEQDNALISPDIIMKYGVSEYIDHIIQFDLLKGSDLAEQTSIRKATYLFD